jgi:putative inorganic carbon (HCO3(-)) transporter
MGRIWAWQFCINLANHRFMGGGFAIYNAANFAVYGPSDAIGFQAAHSIYFGVLGEHGYFGLMLFLAVWWLSFREAGKLRKVTRDQSDVQWAYYLAGMCQVSLVGYLVGGAFLQLAYFDLPYNIIIIIVITHRWIVEGGSRNETVGAFGALNNPHNALLKTIVPPRTLP